MDRPYGRCGTRGVANASSLVQEDGMFATYPPPSEMVPSECELERERERERESQVMYIVPGVTQVERTCMKVSLTLAVCVS